MCGVPERFCEKYSNFYWDILLRTSHALDGRGSHSLASFRDLGERLADQPTVTFAVGLVAGLGNNIARTTFQSQDISDLPWMRWSGLQECERRVSEHVSALHWWRCRVHILVMLPAYCSRPRDLRCFWMSQVLSKNGSPNNQYGDFNLRAEAEQQML